MNIFYTRFPKFFISMFALAIFSILIDLAHAESIVWSHQMPDLPFLSARWTQAKENKGWLRDIQVSVEYRTKVLDAQGAVVACGSVVPKGTSLRFIMEPHRDEDIFWFATGNFNDSPYGVWIPGAAAPQNMCSSPVNVTGSETDGDRTHAMYVVSPPQSSIIDGLSGHTCSGSATSMTCVMDTVGTTTAIFRFAKTESYMYGANSRNDTWVCWSGPAKPNRAESRCRPQGCETLVLPPTYVPEQVISCPITVTDAPPSGVPAAPVVGMSGLSCVAGTPFSITMTATDPDGDGIRYGIDWDADGTIDQFVPSSGYVSSGTAQTASRTYAIAGAKTIRVLTQDNRGSISAFTAFSFDCAQASTTNDGSEDEVHSTFLPGTGLGGGAIGIGNDASSVSVADLSLRVIPSLVRAGQTARVHWSSNGSMVICSVSAPGGGSWNALQSRVGGEQSLPINRTTTYTLRCIDAVGDTHTKTAKVSVIPSWRER